MKAENTIENLHFLGFQFPWEIRPKLKKLRTAINRFTDSIRNIVARNLDDSGKVYAEKPKDIRLSKC